MSFHPLMVYDREHFQQSERARLDEGAPFSAHDKVRQTCST